MTSTTLSSDFNLQIDECSANVIEGPLDVDSSLVMGSNLLGFAPHSVNYVSMYNRKYSLCKNVKATKHLETVLIQKGLYNRFGEFCWWEAKLLTLGKNSIFVLFLVEEGKKHTVNIFQDFVQKVVKKALKSLPSNSLTMKYYSGNKLASKTPVKIFEADYEFFVFLIALHTSIYLNDENQNLVNDVFFYFCEHGERSDISSGLLKLQTVISFNPNYIVFIIFIQIHFGFTMNCPQDTVYLFKLKNLKSDFLNPDWNMRKMFFLLKFGHFCDVTEIHGFTSISYAQCYETIQHRIPRSRYNESMFCYALTNGFSINDPEFRKHADKTLDGIGNLISLSAGHNECLDIRVEVVENYPDINKPAEEFPGIFDILSPKKYTNYYSYTARANKPEKSLSRFPEFLDMIFSKKSLHIVKNWNNYVRSQIGNELTLLQTVKSSRRHSSPTLDYLNSVYWAENKLIAFLDGNKKRFDYEQLVPCHVFQRSSPYYTIAHSPADYVIPDSIFLAHTNWKYFGSRTHMYFQLLYAISALPKTDDRTEYFFQVLAIFWKTYVSNSCTIDPKLNPKTYFKTSKGSQINCLRARAVILNDIVNPKTLPMKLIVAHCFGRQPSSSSRLKASIESFLQKYVKYIPARLLDSKVNWKTWAKILSSQDMLRLGAINAMNGKSKRELNLLQNKNLKKAVERLTAGLQ